jgi:hypothetical protein
MAQAMPSQIVGSFAYRFGKAMSNHDICAGISILPRHNACTPIQRALDRLETPAQFNACPTPDSKIKQAPSHTHTHHPTNSVDHCRILKITTFHNDTNISSVSDVSRTRLS